jgi:hypothetical protein
MQRHCFHGNCVDNILTLLPFIATMQTIQDGVLKSASHLSCIAKLFAKGGRRH